MEQRIKRKNKTGFSLIEIMVAIAIVAILSAVVLVSMKSWAAKGRSTKALTSLSSVIPSMISCWGNTGKVNDPSSGVIICQIGSTDVDSYGRWPGTTGDLSSYEYDDENSIIDDTNKKFVFSLTSGDDDDDKRICCNSAMSGCKILDSATVVCDADTVND